MTKRRSDTLVIEAFQTLVVGAGPASVPTSLVEAGDRLRQAQTDPWNRRGRALEELSRFAALFDAEATDVPAGWGAFPDGTPQPDWAARVRRSREEH